MCVNLTLKFVSEDVMKRLFVLFIAVLLLSGCAGRGFFSGAVDGDKMVRARVIDGDAAGSVMPWAEAQAGVTEARVEETSESIIGVSIEIRTDKVDVKVSK